MPPLPNVSGTDVRRAFEKLGWKFIRQSGSHMILAKSGEIASLSIPKHREVARGTLRSLIRAANVTTNEFIEALG